MLGSAVNIDSVDALRESREPHQTCTYKHEQADLESYGYHEGRPTPEQSDVKQAIREFRPVAAVRDDNDPLVRIGAGICHGSTSRKPRADRTARCFV